MKKLIWTSIAVSALFLAGLICAIRSSLQSGDSPELRLVIAGAICFTSAGASLILSLFSEDPVSGALVKPLVYLPLSLAVANIASVIVGIIITWGFISANILSAIMIPLLMGIAVCLVIPTIIGFMINASHYDLSPQRLVPKMATQLAAILVPCITTLHFTLR